MTDAIILHTEHKIHNNAQLNAMSYSFQYRIKTHVSLSQFHLQRARRSSYKYVQEEDDVNNSSHQQTVAKQKCRIVES